MKISELPILNNLSSNDLTIVNKETNTNKTSVQNFVKTGFPYFYKIRTTPSTRESSDIYRLLGGGSHMLPDEFLYFTYPELGATVEPNTHASFEITCRAFFTGGPPIAFINEPSSGWPNVYFLQPKIYKMANQSNHILVSDEIKNLQSINDTYTDTVEPMTYYEVDPNSYGYFVEIKMVTISYLYNGGGTSGGTHTAGPNAGIPGDYFRWACAIPGQQTRIESGIIIAKRIR